jgi:hypothetical protein
VQQRTKQQVAREIAADYAGGVTRKQLELDILMAIEHFSQLALQGRLLASKTHKQTEQRLKEFAVQVTAAKSSSRSVLDILRYVYHEGRSNVRAEMPDEFFVKATSHKHIKELIRLLRRLPVRGDSTRPISSVKSFKKGGVRGA